MRLTSLTIKNFKGIDEEGVRIQFAPITLLFGPNNAGKSTVMQALYLAREVFCQAEPDLEYTDQSGKGLDLGSFKDYVHRHDLGRTVRIGLELQTDGLPLMGDSLEIQQREGWEEIEPILDRVQSVCVEVGIGWNADRRGAVLQEYSIALNGVHLTRLELDHQRKLVYFEQLNPTKILSNTVVEYLTGELLNNILGSHETERENEFDDLMREYCDAVNEGIDPLLKPFSNDVEIISTFTGFEPRIPLDPHWYHFSLNDSMLLGWDGFLPLDFDDIQPGYDPQSMSVAFISNCLTLLSNLILGPCQVARSFLNTLLYLGPLRTVPDRGLHRFQKLSFNRWADGLAAWDAIATASPEKLEHLNTCLHNVQDPKRSLAMQYIIQQEQYLALPARGPLALALRQTVLDDFDESALPLLRQFLAQEPELRLKLQNIETGVVVEPHDMGTGISQVVPVVAAAVLAKRNAFVMIEQPELHIHPKQQVALGDVFIKAALGQEEGPMFLLETHSEHLLLRLLRRIRQTNEGNDELDLNFTHEKLIVNWIGSTDGRTEVVQLDLDEDGSFLTPWPEGFFNERRKELFG